MVPNELKYRVSFHGEQDQRVLSDPRNKTRVNSLGPKEFSLGFRNKHYGGPIARDRYRNGNANGDSVQPGSAPMPLYRLARLMA